MFDVSPVLLSLLCNEESYVQDVSYCDDRASRKVRESPAISQASLPPKAPCAGHRICAHVCHPSVRSVVPGLLNLDGRDAKRFVIGFPDPTVSCSDNRPCGLTRSRSSHAIDTFLARRRSRAKKNFIRLVRGT